MAKKNALAAFMAAEIQARVKQIVAEQTKARLSLAFDAAILAAHEVFEMGPGRAGAFRKAYVEAIEEMAGLFVDDADLHGDKKLEYAKAKRDEAIRRIVGEDNFVPFEISYGAAYMDELNRIRVMKGDAGSE